MPHRRKDFGQERREAHTGGSDRRQNMSAVQETELFVGIKGVHPLHKRYLFGAAVLKVW